MFLETENKEKYDGLFNDLFIRKAINLALDKASNEKETCSNLL